MALNRPPILRWAQMGPKFTVWVLVPWVHDRVSKPLSLDKGFEPYLTPREFLSEDRRVWPHVLNPRRVVANLTWRFSDMGVQRG